MSSELEHEPPGDDDRRHPHRRLRRLVVIGSLVALAAPVAMAGAASASSLTSENAAGGFLSPSPAGGSFFGEDVALDAAGTVAVVGSAGAPGCPGVAYPTTASCPPTFGQGEAWVFTRGGSAPNYTWTEVAALQAPSPTAASWFGHAVAISPAGNEIVVGAPGTNNSAGAAYIFSGSGSSWSSGVALTTAAPLRAGENFGSAVAISGSAGSYTVAVGAPSPYNNSAGSDGPDNGTVHVYTESGGNFGEAQVLSDSTAAQGQTGSDSLGTSVALSGNGATLLGGAPGVATDNRLTNDDGAAFVFTTGDNWAHVATTTEIAAPVATTNTDLQFGFDVSINSAGTVALIGGPSVTSGASNAYPDGGAFVYSGGGASWSLAATLTPADGQAQDGFGLAVALSADGTTAFVGAPNHPADGAGYLYNAANAAWSGSGPATAVEVTDDNLGQANNQLGFSVSLSSDGSTAMVGALDYASGDNEANAGITFGFGYTPPSTSTGGGTSGGGSTGGSTSSGSSTSSGGSTSTSSGSGTSSGGSTVIPTPLVVVHVHLLVLVVRVSGTIRVPKGATYTLHFNLHGSKGEPHGRVFLKSGHKTECSGSIAKNGKVSCKLVAKHFSLGRHVLEATFAGTGTYSAFTKRIVLIVLR